MRIEAVVEEQGLRSLIERFWTIAGPKIQRLAGGYRTDHGSPVFTVQGSYHTKGWTEWTEGFLYGLAVLHFDATGDTRSLELGRRGTVEAMATHVSHIGVHDHGFNNVSTYGNLRRLMREGRIPHDDWEMAFYELALQVSGAVQAARWTATADGDGFIYTFNGPHSLFIDTIRSLRSLAVAHELNHVLMGEHDERISLLERAVQHARTTARYNIYYGEGRDIYDVPGRVAHESIFNTNDGEYRCPSSQQGYSPYSTWSRGLAWAMLGYPEQLEFLDRVTDEELASLGGRAGLEAMMLRAARAPCDFYLEHTPSDGIPYWDFSAPGLVELEDHGAKPADPFNTAEPVDSSSAAIAAQGLLRLGRWLQRRGDSAGDQYWRAGIAVLGRLLEPPYLSEDPDHEGLLLHGVYHRPGGWDHVPDGGSVPRGESVMWGDYHLAELVLYVQRALDSDPYHTFFGP